MVSRKFARIRAVLRKAKEVKDPLAEFAAAVRPCSGNAQLVQVRSYHARDMPKELQEWCLATCRQNMAALYDRVWTWSDTKKRKQLTSAASRFLVAHDAGSGRAPLAYVNYRFEEDEGHAVLYCYELQVIPAAQSRGLGRMLMELAEQIAWGAGMSKLMLTVFCENTAAVAFYRKLGYGLDETSPDYCHGGGTSSNTSDGGSHGGGSGGTSSSMGGTGSSSAGGGSGGSGSGSGGRSCASSFNGGSGSQTDSAGAGCGYHIMSKRAPAGGLLQGQPERQAAAVGPEQCVGAAPRREGKEQDEAGEPLGRPDIAPLQPESNKRLRTDASGPQRMRLSEGSSGEGAAAAGGCGGGAAAAAATAPRSQPQAPSVQPAEQQCSDAGGKEAGWRDATREQVEQQQQPLNDALRELRPKQQQQQPDQLQLEQQQLEQQSEPSRQQQGGVPRVAEQLRQQPQEQARRREQHTPEQHPWSKAQRDQPEQQQPQQELRQQQRGPQTEPQWQGMAAQPPRAPVTAASPEREAEGDAAGAAGCVELPGLSPPARHGEVDAERGTRGERWACEETGRRPAGAAEAEVDTAMAEADAGVA